MGRLSRFGWRSVDPPSRPVLFVNRRSGGGKADRARLVERARERGIVTVVLEPGESLNELVRAAVADGADALGVAGGDGSLALVAAAAVEHGLPFVCLPAGTRNHFALDVGVDRHDLVGGLDAFSEGVERSVDVGSADGRLFLNNVSLGIYGDAVRRPEYREAKTRTLLETTAEVLGPSGAAADLRVIDDEGREHRDPSVVLVSNNPYALDRPVAPGTRPRLDSGQLGIVVLDRPRADLKRPGRAWTADSFEVDAAGPLAAGVDGEAVQLEAPLSLTILPRALRVRISCRHPGVSPSGRLP